jgi:hypothetical protein
MYLLGTGIFLSILFSNTLSRCNSLNMSDQVSHPCTMTDTVVLLHILIFILFDSEMEDIKNSERKVSEVPGI